MFAYMTWLARDDKFGPTWDIPVAVEEFTAGQADFLEHVTAETHGEEETGNELGGEKVGGINTRRRAP